MLLLLRFGSSRSKPPQPLPSSRERDRGKDEGMGWDGWREGYTERGREG